jgi:general secretion pathway protein I
LTAQRRNNAAGFTLIEVLVAFTIAAILLIPILRLISLGLGSFGAAQDNATATLWAESELDHYGIDTPISEGAAAGDLPGRIHWERQTERYRDNAMTDAPVFNSFVPYAITLTLSWPERFGRRSITFHTLRLAPPPRP